ncbi:MAG: peptidoglycan recognition protein family protein [Sulfurimonas sp.]|nr:peptidoglycan recognition protein family protein [Sulfurimonas sp.]
MYNFILLASLLFSPLFALEIRETPIEFGETRNELTKKYIKEHYGLDVNDIKIVPKMVVVHHTAIDDFGGSLSCFASQTISSNRPDINNGGAVNVSAHFLVARDGTVHQLMPLDTMARHVIGLNYNSIGIENVGGQGGVDNLTKEQLEANIALISELQKRFPTIEYLIGHYEYKCFDGHELWLERDKGYRTHKDDPSQRFMDELRANVSGFKSAPCGQGQR